MTDESSASTQVYTGAYRRTWNTSLTLAGASVTLAFAGFNRPLWMDEVLHFAMGGMTFGRMIQTIDYTSTEINHGQTGIYMFFDWLLLQVFGASAIALRTPSLIAGGVLCWATVLFIRNRGLSPWWQLLGLLSLTSQFTLVAYIGEARPYMPLAASVASMLVFFSANVEQRRTVSVRVLGFVGLIGGALIQPYWILYLAVILLFAGIALKFGGFPMRNFRDLLRWAAPWLLMTSLFLYVLVGRLTWMRRVRNFEYDPFEMVGGTNRLVTVFTSDHLSSHVPMWVWLVQIGLTVVAIARISRSAFPWVVAKPMLLWLIGVLSSIAVSWLSYSRSYWIFERQWLPGMVLCAIASTWLFGEILRHSQSRDFFSRAVCVTFAGLVLWGSVMSFIAIFATYPAWGTEQVVFSEDQRSITDLFAEGSDESIVHAANVNVERGGRVWPEFSTWYSNQAGMRPEFRLSGPSWSDFLGE